MPGHWEGDLVIGKGGKTAVATLVERTSRFLILVPLTGRDSLTVTEAVIAATDGLPASIRRSLTWDCVGEMAGHATVAATGLPVFFAHPYSPWERGSNENLNRIVREFSRKASRSPRTPTIWPWVASEINDRHRKIHNWKKPRDTLASVSRIHVDDAVARLWNLARHDRDLPKTPGFESSAYLTPFANLQRNLNYARSLAIAGQHLGHLQPQAFEVDDVFRAAWVQGVAALDHWVRQEIHHRMLRLARDEAAERPNGFAKFEITLDLVERRNEENSSSTRPSTKHCGSHSAEPPTSGPTASKKASDWFVTPPFWERIAAVLSERPGGTAIAANGIRDQLNAIVERRRNKIAHEYDDNPAGRRGKRPIYAAGATACPGK